MSQSNSNSNPQDQPLNESAMLPELFADLADGSDSLPELDSSNAAALAAWHQDRLILREGFRDSVATADSLPSDFAARVVDLASDAAVREGLDKTHPLRLLNAQVADAKVSDGSFDHAPVTLPRPSDSESGSIFGRKFIVAIVAAAAGLLIAVALVKDKQSNPDATQLAQTQGSQSNSDFDEAASLDATTPMIASSLQEFDESSSEVGPTDDALPMPAVAEAVVADEGPLFAASTTMSSESIAMPTEMPEAATDLEVASLSKQARIGELAVELPMSTPEVFGDDMMVAMKSVASPVLIYDVQLTRTGQAEDCIGDAMRRAGLSSISRKAIDTDVVAAARAAAEEDATEDGLQIIYLEASAKRLDRLFSLLVEDIDGVASIGMALSMDGPIIEVATDLGEIDPTKVRSDTVAYQVAGQSQKQTDALTSLLQQQTYVPLPRTSDAVSFGLGGQSTRNHRDDVALSDGLDVTSRVLVLVR